MFANLQTIGIFFLQKVSLCVFRCFAKKRFANLKGLIFVFGTVRLMKIFLIIFRDHV